MATNYAWPRDHLETVSCEKWLKAKNSNFYNSACKLIVINLQYCPLDLYLYGDKSYQISYKNVTLP